LGPYRILLKKGSLLLIAALFAAACSVPKPRAVTGKLHPEADEEDLWLRAAKLQEHIERTETLCRDKSLLSYLNQTARRIQPPQTRTAVRCRVYVIQDPIPNAFALPNGSIYIHSGMIAGLENEAQLAAVLAHEIAHCINRHALRALRDSQANLSAASPSRAEASNKRFSQSLEAEADRVALKLVAKAGYDPGAALEAMRLSRSGIKEPSNPREAVRLNRCKSRLRDDVLEQPEGTIGKTPYLRAVLDLILENAALCIKTGRFHSAQSGLSKYLELDPDNPRAFYLMGELYRQRTTGADRGKALSYYQKAIRIDRCYPEPYRSQGIIYLKAGKRRLAHQRFEQYLELSPNAHRSAYIRHYLSNPGL